MYELEAIIGRREALKDWIQSENAAFPCELDEGLVLVPMTERLLARLNLGGGVEYQGGEEAINKWATCFSKGRTLAYVTALMSSALGGQRCWVWRDGAMLLDKGDINAALKSLGVRCRDRMDEFDSVGLGRHRKTDDWAVESVVEGLRKAHGSNAPRAALEYSNDDSAVQNGVRKWGARMKSRRSFAFNSPMVIGDIFAALVKMGLSFQWRRGDSEYYGSHIDGTSAEGDEIRFFEGKWEGRPEGFVLELSCNSDGAFQNALMNKIITALDAKDWRETTGH